MTFTFSVTAADWGRFAPELVLIGMVLLVMLTDLFLPQAGTNPKERGPANFTVLPVLSVLGLFGAIAATIILFVLGDYQTAFNQMIGSDQGTLLGYVIILSASTLGVLLSPAYLKRLELRHQGEYYALILLATIGMMLLAGATSFLTVFLGIEMLSLALYILCSFVARRTSSQESGMKYFLLSSFASAFLLYGIALIYGATGKTTFSGIANFFAIPPQVHGATVPPLHIQPSNLLLIGMGLLIVGFAFKISAIPFQAWAPDVYTGAPAPVTAFMSVGTKAAALIAFARVFDVTLLSLHSQWQPVIWAIAILTIIGGNVLALVQSNVKRLLAYSSIAHAGYLLIGVVVGGVIGLSAILFYLLSYTFLNLGAFGAVSVLERPDNSGLELSEIRGLWYRRPVVAGLLAFFLLALAGFPPMAGFAAKYYIFYAALQAGYPELLITAVIASVLGMYYYLRVIAAMFMERVPESVASPVVSATPAPTLPKQVSGKLTDTRSGGTATAVAVKPATAPAKTAVAIEATPEKQPVERVGWMTWTSLGLAVIGSLAMGTALPFWLVNLAQQAAQMMLK